MRRNASLPAISLEKGRAPCMDLSGRDPRRRRSEVERHERYAQDLREQIAATRVHDGMWVEASPSSQDASPSRSRGVGVHGSPPLAGSPVSHRSPPLPAAGAWRSSRGLDDKASNGLLAERVAQLQELMLDRLQAIAEKHRVDTLHLQERLAHVERDTVEAVQRKFGVELEKLRQTTCDSNGWINPAVVGKQARMTTTEGASPEADVRRLQAIVERQHGRLTTTEGETLQLLEQQLRATQEGDRAELRSMYSELQMYAEDSFVRDEAALQMQQVSDEAVAAIRWQLEKSNDAEQAAIEELRAEQSMAVDASARLRKDLVALQEETREKLRKAQQQAAAYQRMQAQHWEESNATRREVEFALRRLAALELRLPETPCEVTELDPSCGNKHDSTIQRVAALEKALPEIRFAIAQLGDSLGDHRAWAQAQFEERHSASRALVCALSRLESMHKTGVIHKDPVLEAEKAEHLVVHSEIHQASHDVHQFMQDYPRSGAHSSRLRAAVPNPSPTTAQAHPGVFGILRRSDDDIHSLTARCNTIGRGSGCSVCFNSSQGVSSVHAQIEFVSSGEAMLSDMDSLNGTFVNGHRVTSSGNVSLAEGAVVQFGVDGPVCTFEYGCLAGRKVDMPSALMRSWVQQSPDGRMRAEDADASRPT